MAKYTCTVHGQATTSEQAFIDLDCPSSTVIKITGVRIGSDLSAEGNARVKLLRKSAIGTGSTTGTKVARDPLSPASVVTATVKNGSNTYNVGTVTDTVDEVQVNTRSIFGTLAILDRDMIITASDGIFGINIVADGTLTNMWVSVEWVE